MIHNVKKLTNETLTVDELVTIARRVPNHGLLVHAMQGHPKISFEYIEMSVSDRCFKVSRPTE